MNLPKFDREYWITQMKNEIGLSDIPYEELDQYKVTHDSILGKDSDEQISAKDYVDRQLAIIEEQYKQFDSQLENSTKYSLSIGNMAIPQERMEILQPVVSKFDPNKIVCFDMSIPKGDRIYNLTVFIHNNKDQENYLENHWGFVGKRTKDELTGLETICTFYQFVNHFGDVKNPKEAGIEEYDVTKRMDMVFDGLKLEGLE